MFQDTPRAISGGSVRGVGNGVALPVHMTGTSIDVSSKPLPSPAPAPPFSG